MKVSYRNTTSAGLVVLVGTMLLEASPVQAQKPATPRNLVSATLTADDGKAVPLYIDVDGEKVTNDVVLAKIQDPVDETLGATLRPVEDTLRAQLDIPAGKGLLVSCLRGDGACTQAGLKQNDILLSLGGKPLAAAEDLTTQLKAAGEAAVPLDVLRAGKPLTLSVRPVYRVTLGPALEQKAEYFIGVSIDTPEEAVRAQLALPSGQGVIVSEVVSGSPAEKAGVKKHDIILEMDGKPIDSPQTLARQVQATQGKPATLTVLRGGKRVTIPVTAALRQVEASAPEEKYRLWLLHSSTSATRPYLNLMTSQPEARLQGATAPGAEELRQRLEHVENELKALRTAVDQLNETLRNERAKQRK